MFTPFIEMPQREEALPLTTIKPPWPVAPKILAGVAFDDDLAGHECSHRCPDPPNRGCLRRLLVHAAAIIAGGPFDGDLNRGIQAAGNRMCAACVLDLPNGLVGVVCLCVQASCWSRAGLLR